jgi:hypothetical protein
MEPNATARYDELKCEEARCWNVTTGHYVYHSIARRSSRSLSRFAFLTLPALLGTLSYDGFNHHQDHTSRECGDIYLQRERSVVRPKVVGCHYGRLS